MPAIKRKRNASYGRTTKRSRNITYRRKAVRKGGRYMYKKRRYPSRFAKRSLAATARMIGETKYKGFKTIDDAPESIQSGAQTFYNGYDLGGTTVQTGFATLGAFKFGEQTSTPGKGLREGMTMYMLKTSGHLRVAMTPFDNQNMSTTQLGKSFCTFRVLMVRMKRAYMPTGQYASINTSLFLNEHGDTIGHATPGVTINDITMCPVNKKSFHVIQDVKFNLSPPAMFVAHDTNNDAGYSGPSGRYPHMRDIYFSLRHNRKVEFSNSTDEPITMDPHFYLVVYGGSPTREGSVNNWETVIRGTTTALDM